MTAEAIVDAYFVNKGWGKPAKLVPYPHVPHLFQGEFSDGFEYVLVHDGALVTDKGRQALGGYMRKVNLLAHPIDVDDVLILLSLFVAYPPTGSAYPASAFLGMEHKQLHPTFEKTRDTGRLVVNYLPMPGGAGGRANPNLARLHTWTLSISKDYELTWSEDIRDYDTSKP